MSPARTKEDLPLPEVPTTARKRLVAKRHNSSSTSSSRPKNRADSSAVNGRNPGNGSATVEAVIIVGHRSLRSQDGGRMGAHWNTREVISVEEASPGERPPPGRLVGMS